MIGFECHDHATCISDAVQSAIETCEAAGLQFTPVRRRVLEILLEKHRALGAYDILEHLRDEGLGSQPPVAYRALDFLVSHGFVHKIERLNSFVACSCPGTDHAPLFLICQSCQSVAEADSDELRGILSKTAQTVGFQVSATVVEVAGLCPTCQQDGTA